MTPRERLADARLYLVCDARPRAFLDAALRGGADLIQLRDKTLDDDGLIERRDGVPRRRRRARRAVHPQRPPRPRRGVRRRRRPRRPGRRHARAGARGRRAGPDRRPLDARAATRPTRRTPTPTSTTSRSARCTRRRPSRAGPPPGSTTSPTPRARSRKPWFAIGGLDAHDAAGGRRRAARAASSSCARSPRPPIPEAAARALRDRAGGARWGSAAVSDAPAAAASRGTRPAKRA